MVRDQSSEDSAHRPPTIFPLKCLAASPLGLVGVRARVRVRARVPAGEGADEDEGGGEGEGGGRG